MFTGLVSAVGTVRSARAADGGRTLVISAPWRGLALGESVAVDGACLTVTARQGRRFRVDVSPETLRRTTLGTLAKDARVNLERAATIERFSRASSTLLPLLASEGFSEIAISITCSRLLGTISAGTRGSVMVLP